jgi:hypothetical protein
MPACPSIENDNAAPSPFALPLVRPASNDNHERRAAELRANRLARRHEFATGSQQAAQ